MGRGTGNELPLGVFLGAFVSAAAALVASSALLLELLETGTPDLGVGFSFF